MKDPQPNEENIINLWTLLTLCANIPMYMNHEYDLYGKL